MPGVARANGIDTVSSLTGSGKNCVGPLNTVTGPSSSSVFVGGYQLVVEGDQVGSHPAAGCGPDTSTLTTFSSTVRVGGKGVGRVGDKYTADNTITSGSSSVFIG